MQYESFLQLRLLKLLEVGPLTFDQILSLAEGTYPVEVREALTSLVSAGSIVPCGDSYRLTLGPSRLSELNASGTAEKGGFIDVDRVLGDPHPVDYDWRFSEETRWELASLARRFQSGNVRVGLLGVGTLLPIFAQQGLDVILVDTNSYVLRDLKSMGLGSSIVEHDLFERMPANIGKRDFVIADPPWYAAYYEAFLMRAAEWLRLDGALVLSVLQRLTRPSAISDRAEIVRFGAGVGFDLWEVAAGAISYSTPRFEQASLASQGINCLPWRKADRYMFRKVSEPDPDVKLSETQEMADWVDFEIGRARIKVKKREDCASTFSYRPVSDEGPVLPSVSARAGYRSKIDVWTSDNCAYAVSRIALVLESLSFLQQGGTPGVAVERVRETSELSRGEAEELVRFLQELELYNGLRE